MLQDCPWDSFRQSKLEFCEEVLCAWVKQPGNTWSCVGFILVGLWIWRHARASQHASLRVVGITSIFMGLGSAFYHASGTWIGMLADYTGMFMGSSLMVALNLRRWLGWRFGALLGVFLALTALFLASTVLLPGTERWVFAFGSPCWVIELRLFFRDRRQMTYRWLLWGYLAVGIAALFWWLDAARILCNPANHILSGHVAWHLLLAAAYLCFYWFYAQFQTFADRE